MAWQRSGGLFPRTISFGFTVVSFGFCLYIVPLLYLSIIIMFEYCLHQFWIYLGHRLYLCWIYYMYFQLLFGFILDITWVYYQSISDIFLAGLNARTPWKTIVFQMNPNTLFLQCRSRLWTLEMYGFHWIPMHFEAVQRWFRQ